MKVDTRKYCFGKLREKALAQIAFCDSSSFKKGAELYIWDFFTYFQCQWMLNLDDNGLAEVDLNKVLVDTSLDCPQGLKNGNFNEDEYWQGCDQASQICSELVSLAYSEDTLAA